MLFVLPAEHIRLWQAAAAGRASFTPVAALWPPAQQHTGPAPGRCLETVLHGCSGEGLQARQPGALPQEGRPGQPATQIILVNDFDSLFKLNVNLHHHSNPTTEQTTMYPFVNCPPLLKLSDILAYIYGILSQNVCRKTRHTTVHFRQLSKSYLLENNLLLPDK